MSTETRGSRACIGIVGVIVAMFAVAGCNSSTASTSKSVASPTPALLPTSPSPPAVAVPCPVDAIAFNGSLQSPASNDRLVSASVCRYTYLSASLTRVNLQASRFLSAADATLLAETINAFPKYPSPPPDHCAITTPVGNDFVYFNYASGGISFAAITTDITHCVAIAGEFPYRKGDQKLADVLAAWVGYDKTQWDTTPAPSGIPVAS